MFATVPLPRLVIFEKSLVFLSDSVTVPLLKSLGMPVSDEPKAAPDLHDQITKALAAFESIGVSDEQLSAHVGKQAAAWTMDDLNALSALFASIRDGQATVSDVFGGDV